MSLIESKTPLQDSKDALQKESGNPVDFKMHDTVRAPNTVYATTQTAAKVGTFSPTIGDKAILGATDKGNEDAEAAKNRAMKQSKAGV